MRFKDLLYETWHALTVNKGRSLLTILGIVIGISAVIAMTSLIGGVQNSLMDEMGFDQARKVSIYPYNPKGNISFDDVDKLRELLPDYEKITGCAWASDAVSTAQQSIKSPQIYCVKADYFSIDGLRLSEGRFFSEAEEASGARYVLVDRVAVKELFGDPKAPALGKTIQIGTNDFEIIGVVDIPPMLSYNPSLFVPFTTGQVRLETINPSLQLVGLLHEGVDVNAAVATTTTVASEYFGVSEEDVSIMAYDSLIKQLDTTLNMFSLLMGSVASISLFVGGIGIMNMMLTNVTERIREIGLRKSLGAKRRDITKQFLMEAIALCIVGGAIGILVGLLAAWGLGALISISGMVSGAVVPVLSPGIVVGTVVICTSIGFIFGYYPARRAAKLDPVESLRYQ